jgi:hypothetical protein
MTIHSQQIGGRHSAVSIELHPGQVIGAPESTGMRDGTNLVPEIVQIVGIPRLLPFRGIRVGTSEDEGAR